jgi:periplasmic protein CpxP/Spy
MRMAENPRMRQYLGLNDDQVARLHKLGVEAEEAGVKSRSQMELAHIELRELMRADNPDQSAIMAKMDQVNQLRGAMEKERVRTMLEARNVLTPDQQKKLKAMRENHGGMEHRPMMQHRGGPGGPGRPGAPGAAPQNPPAPPAQ